MQPSAKRRKVIKVFKLTGKTAAEVRAVGKEVSQEDSNILNVYQTPGCNHAYLKVKILMRIFPLPEDVIRRILGYLHPRPSLRCTDQSGRLLHYPHGCQGKMIAFRYFSHDPNNSDHMWQRRQILKCMLNYVCHVLGKPVDQDEYLVPYDGAIWFEMAYNGDAEAYGRLLELMSNHELNNLLEATGWNSSFLEQSLLESSRRRMQRMYQYMF